MRDVRKIHILTPLDKGMNSGLIQRGATELVAEGFGTLTPLGELSQNDHPTPLLVIDGDSQESLFKKVQALSIAPDFHLIVTDLGIETDEDTGFDSEDLQLLKDAVQAECTLVEGTAPQFNCPCCG